MSSFRAHNLMREYCLEAKKYGDEKLPDGINPKNVTVILNPTANRRKAAKLFEKYCAPILHLAGLCVDILPTESEGHARTLVEKIKSTDAIVIAGGDGTVSEVITGLFRRTNNDRIVNPCPIGILPLGQTNSLGKLLFPGGESLATVKSLADASLAIVKEYTKQVDVMKVEIIQQDEEITPEVQNEVRIEPEEDTSIEKTEIDVNEVNTHEISVSEVLNSAENVTENSGEKSRGLEEAEDGPKAIYALSSFEWGAHRDVRAKQDKYWYWGSLRKYATYVFNGYKNSLTWDCSADLNYLEPCDGCSNCRIPDTSRSGMRWWSRFFTRPKPMTRDYSSIINEKCGQSHTREIRTTDLTLLTSNIINSSQSELQLNIGPDSTKYVEFVKDGFRTVNGERRNFQDVIRAREIQLVPRNLNSKQIWFSIDREHYEAKPVKITILPRVLNVFCKEQI